MIRDLSGGLQALAAGDLQSDLTTPFAVEYEPLRADYNLPWRNCAR